MTMIYPDIDALLFDFGNVIVSIDFQRAFEYWSRLGGVPVESIAAGFVSSRAYEAHERGEIDCNAYFSSLRADLGLRLSDEDFLAGWNSIFLAPMPGIPERLHLLAAEWPLYLFSNTNAAHHAYWSRAYAEVLTPFSAIFCSHEIGARKPSMKSFQTVAERIGVAPERIAFFDDLEKNVLGAREAGLRAFHFTHAGDIDTALSRQPD